MSAAALAPIDRLKGVGPALSERLAALGLSCVQDLWFHLPLRYEDRTHITPLRDARIGAHVLVVAQVEDTSLRRGRRRSLLVTLSDGSAFLVLRFFHFSPAQMQRFRPGVWLRCFGEIRPGPSLLEMVHPDYAVIEGPASPGAVDDALTPVYPVTQGVSQGRLRALAVQGLALLQRGDIPELLPESWLAGFHLPPLREALMMLHQPPPDVAPADLERPCHPARRRLIVEELLAHHLSLRNVRRRVQALRAPCLAGESPLLERFYAALPFKLTGAQRRVIDEIMADLGRGRPMLRLVQGDVGSGKTVVSAAAAVRALEGGYQVVLMAPTELLAEQHFLSFDAWLTPLGISVHLLSGRSRKARRAQELAALEAGEAGILVGTHAVFQDEVRFARLGLVIVDEQHRFGVHQRMALRDKGVAGERHPHQLVMTATPIPRTLAMSAYADLDTSVIDELPPGRSPVSTVAVPDTRRGDVLDRVAAACAEGRQAYWVCTLVEESEALQCEAAEATAAALREQLPHLSVGLVHGRMKGAEKERVMRAFKEGGIHLLVATTVIEVGVDVPNASLLVIENAERLGLAQLHQLRGRVGRGAVRSHCVLMYHPPLSEAARARLQVLRETQDGFEIARRDLALRGPGEVLGTRQTGLMQMRVADLVRDADLIPEVQVLADRLLAERPDAVAPLMRRWLGEVDDYAQV